MNITMMTALIISAEAWFNQGTKLLYDSKQKSIIDTVSSIQSNQYFVWEKYVFYPNQKTDNTITFLPGFPTGSYDWAKMDSLMEKQIPVSRLFIEYLGQGYSDKPVHYKYSTFERADLVEAIWKKNNIKSTFVVTFDYSSLVVMELLRRQQEQIEKGIQPATKITKVLLINGGYFIDGHSHPAMTTPLLKTAFGKSATKMAQKSFFMFSQMIKGLWSKEYKISKQELREVYKVITKNDGAIFLHSAAGFVDEHKQNGARLDLLSIYEKMKDSVSFHIVGSDKDQFEPKQVKLAKERLGKYGVDISIIKGGHMITMEQPQLLTDIINKLTIN